MLTFGMIIGIKMYPRLGFIYQSDKMDFIEYGKLNEVLNYLQSRYVDTLDQKELTEKAIIGLVRQLDPHSMYLSADIYEAEAYAREGQYVGIGAEYFDYGDSVVILNTIPGSPAAKIDLKPGDVLTVPNEKDQTNFKDYIKSDHEKTLEVKVIKRGGTTELRRMQKEVIYIPSVYDSRMLEAKTGLITLSRFNNRSYKEFMESLEALVENHELENLIIDLRQNPGGYLQQVVQILGQLFDEKGRLLVYTQNKYGQKNEYKSRGNPFFDLRNVIVFIDEGSASASEILAGALQDWDRATIIGRRSFGKGLVQKEFKLTDGSALLLTVEKYYTPSGRMIQKSYANRDAYREELHDRWDNGEMLLAEKMQVIDSQIYYTNSGKAVYGGGGIVPDIFVPVDSLQYLDASRQTVRKMYPFLYELIKEKPEIYNYTPEKLLEWYQQEHIFLKFFKYTELTEKVKWQEYFDEKLKQHLMYFIKGRKEMLKMVDENDPFVQAARANLALDN